MVTVVVGGQAGSEGKGAVTARYHWDREYAWAVRVGGPNAGHSVVDPGTGRKFALRQLPVAAVADPQCGLIVAAGSEVDVGVLSDEVAMLEDAGYRVAERLLVDREATLLEPTYAEAEGTIRTGTTGKGIGAARAARSMRKARRMSSIAAWTQTDTQQLLRAVVREGLDVMVEGTQGYVLGSHAGYYPYCTSGNCRAVDMLAACGLGPMAPEVVVVLRTYPIRIAGESGPLEDEVTWEQVGVEPEITTVTKKERRVGLWNREWARASVDANWGDERPDVALTFADYWWPEIAGMDGDAVLPPEALSRIERIEGDLNAPIVLIGTGPGTQITKSTTGRV
jgi:adenylosuccinate synthase